MFDVLYGHFTLPPFLSELAGTPEMQRLREVRMCNINSLSLTGGANTNRYEHSLGVAHLAQVCADAHPGRMKPLETRVFLMAALLHDVFTAALGHSVQYFLSRKGFRHEAFEQIVTVPRGGSKSFMYQHTQTEPVFFGQPRRIPQILTATEVRKVDSLIRGKGRFGLLLSGTLDLDNIDNVYRLAYHYGFTRETRHPSLLAELLFVKDGVLAFGSNAKPLVEDWIATRRKLYTYLLLNPDEFSAKCMLEEALTLAYAQNQLTYNWNEVDFQLFEKLSKSSHDVSTITSRLMVGQLYGPLGIFISEEPRLWQGILNSAAAKLALVETLQERLRRSEIRSWRTINIGLHLIRDVGKTERQVVFKDEFGHTNRLGKSTNRMLVGVFAKNPHLGSIDLDRRDYSQGRTDKIIYQVLSRSVRDSSLRMHRLYSEDQGARLETTFGS